MKMEFSPLNYIVKQCLQGMEQEEKGNKEEARALFLKAWDEAIEDFEKFLAAYYIARSEVSPSEKLKWFETTLELALTINDDTVKAAFTPLYEDIARCYEALGDGDNARKNFERAASFSDEPSDIGPFYHGTKADLQVGDLLTAGYHSNYQQDLVMNHIYFTALPHGAGLAAALARGEGPERVYIVAPTGAFEHDPNVTNKKFPGNPTRSYRTAAPLKIVGEQKDWSRQRPEELQKWREKLDNNNGEIIN